MNIQDFREYCLLRKGVTEEFPFDNETLVYKVGGKMFALTDIDAFTSINLKNRPEEVIRLVEENAAIIPGYHMNKKHWITVLIDGSLSDKFIKNLIDISYQHVFAGLPAKIRSEMI